MFFDVYRELCKQKNLSPTGAALNMGLSRAAVSAWKNTGRIPQSPQLQKIADYFDVSIDYLIGTQKEKPTVNDDELKNNPLIALYGEIGEYLDDDDLDDIATLMRLRAEIKKNKKG